MTEREQDPGPDGDDTDDAVDDEGEGVPEGPPEIVEAALAELENPADESDEG